MRNTADVIVVGGGPVGVCCALELARAGAHTVLIERETEICPAVGGAHANCGLIVPSDSTPLAAPGALGQGTRWLLDSASPFYIAPRPSPALARWLWLFRAACSPERARAAMPVLRALHVASAALHAELAEAHGDRWHYHHNGLVQVYESQAGLAEAADGIEHERAVGALAEEMREGAARERFPGMHSELAGGFFFPEDAHLDPRLFTQGVAALAAEAGASVAAATEAIALESAGRGAVRVATTRGDIVAGQVVLAAGAWTPALARDLGLRLPIEPAKGYSVDVARPADYPEVPLYLGEAHVVMTPLGDTLRLGSTLELSGWDMRVRRKRVAHLRRGGERALGIAADGPVKQVWRGPRPVSPDGLPLIGRAPRHESVIVATGHCMLGLSLGPVTGRIVAEIAGGGAPSIASPLLSPARFG